MPAAGKRERENDASVSGLGPKKQRHGFRVGPANLPDGPWRRKLAKVKQGLIHQAKVKKQYAKIKSRHLQDEAPKHQKPGDGDDDADGDRTALHPERQAMIHGTSNVEAKDGEATSGDDDDDDDDGGDGRNNATASESKAKGTTDPDAPGGETPAKEDRQGGRGGGGRHKKNNRNKPDYFQKDLHAAEELRRAAEERAAQAKASEEERARRTADRDRMRRAIAKAKRPGPGGKLKLGRESNVLLEKVKKMMGDGGGR